MIIQCPQCHRTWSVEQDSIPLQGIEMHCSQCQLSFTLRAHRGAGGGDPEPSLDRTRRSAAEEAMSPPAAPLPASAPRPEILGIPLNAFLQKDEIPYPVVQAYQTGRQARSIFADIGVPLSRPGIRMVDDDAVEPYGDPEPSSPLHARGGELGTAPIALEQRKYRKGRTKPLRVWPIAWVVLLLVGAVAAGILIRKELQDRTLPSASELLARVAGLLPFGEKDGGSIQFSDLNSYFITTGKGQTPAFVVEGRVTNHFPVPCNFVQVKGVLFDQKGDRAAEEVAYCGNVLRKQDIQTLPPEKIQQTLQNMSGSALSNFNIEPGKSIPFMLVFFNPPENVSEFSVEIFHYQKKKEPGAGGPPSDPL
ncbi:MAG: zinc-ribbon and DUF3426 domain-containing protein [bacterium]